MNDTTTAPTDANQAILGRLADATDFEPIYSRWRHGGWYVHNVRWPNGGCGCVSRNYPDGKWRVVCDPRGFEQQPAFATRDEAALAERQLIQDLQAGAR